MNNIHEKDWAEDDWGGHSGMWSGQREDDDEPQTNLRGESNQKEDADSQHSDK